MSDIFRKSLLNRLPPMSATRAPWAETAGSDDEESEELADGLGELGASLPGPSSPRVQDDLSPLSASQFFSQALEVEPPNTDTTFRIYLTPPKVQPSTSTAARPGPSSSRNDYGTYLVCHHGAGAAGLSFAALAKEVSEQSQGELGVLAFDCRGHGRTRSTARDGDLSRATLVDDLVKIIQHLFPDGKDGPALVLLGHSMGAAPVLRAAPLLQSKGYTIPGVIVLDVVEGTALEALPLMKGILSKRPTSFRSTIDAIHWHLTSNTIRDKGAARVSVPSYLIPAADALDPGPQAKQMWRTDLLATEPFWEEWYEGLSRHFLEARCARLLVLAGQERLDKELMVGQMQGKFQLEVMQDVGHYLHEDDPPHLAGVIVAFWRRNTRVIVPPPKIGSTSALGTNAGGVEVKRVGEM